MTSRPLVHAVGPVALAALAGLALWRAFVPADLLLGVIVGVVAATPAAWLLARPFGGAAGVAAGTLLGVACLGAGLVAVTSDLGSLAGVPQHFSTFLSIGLPADGLDDLAVVPYVVTSLTVVLTAWASLRSRPLVAVLVAAAGMLAAALLAGPVGVPPLVAAAFCAVLAGVLMATSRFDYSELEPLIGTSTAIRRNQRWWRPAVVALPAAGVAVAALVLPTPDTYDVRRWVASDVVLAADENPLAVAARLAADPPRGADEVDVAVTVSEESPGRLRMAVLDQYAPEGWHQLAEYSVTGTHLATGAVAGSRADGTGDETEVVLTDRPGRSGLAALPTGGTPLEVVDATGLRYAAEAGLLLPAGDDRPQHVTYTAEPDAARPAGDFGRPPAGIDRSLSTCPDSELIRGIAQQLTVGVDDPHDRLAVIETWLKYQHLYVPEASGGQTLASVERFLGQDFGVGNLEVFVTAYALVARCAGVPVRVVVGYPAPAAAGITEFAPTDLTAWVETPVAGTGWVVFDPVPTPAEQDRIRDEIDDRDPAEQAEVPPDVTTTTVPSQAPSDPSTTNWGRRALVAAVAVLAAFAALVTWSFVIRRRTVGRRARVADPAMASLLAWTTLLERCNDNGVRLGAHLTAGETARATAGRVPAPVTRMMGELAGVVDRARFDSDHATAADAGLAWALADESLARLPEGWPVWSAPLRHPRRAIARLRLAKGMARTRRRWTGEVPASAAVLDVDAQPHIDGYEVVARAGVGSTAAVYRATQAGTGRTVAIKVFSVDAGSREFDHQRFLWEARVAETVSGQPHLPEVLGSGFTANGRPYLVTKFYENGTLARRVRISGPMPVPQVEALARQLATALDTLHKSGVLHGDVKPENVFVDDDDTVVLGDLGAGWLRADGGPATALTPAYAAPEVWLGHAPTVRSDIYSLGLTLMFAVTGTPPVPGSTPTADEVTAAFESDVAVPLLEVDPRRRLRSAGDVANRFGAEAVRQRGDNGFTLPPPSWTIRS